MGAMVSMDTRRYIYYFVILYIIVNLFFTEKKSDFEVKKQAKQEKLEFIESEINRLSEEKKYLEFELAPSKIKEWIQEEYRSNVITPEKIREMIREELQHRE
jgi:hypothetical protein